MKHLTMMYQLPSLVALAATALAIPLSKRADIDSDAVVGFAQTVPDTTEGTLMLQYQPLLKVVDGCVPFPAVDASGDTR